VIQFTTPYRSACGSEYVAHHVNKFMVSRGHNCRVILHRYKGPLYNYEGVDVFPATGHVDAYRWADVVATHLDFTQYTIMMAHEAKRPLVHFIHNDITYAAVHSAQRGNYVVYNSKWIKDAINYPNESTVLHPPCDVKYYNVNDNPDDNGYTTLISLNERKGGYLFRKIAEAMPDKNFIGVVGSYDNPGPMKLSQDQIINMMPPNVKIVENSPDILSVYRQTRLLLMPSDYESWGRTATEAMCNGIPVVCTPTAGLKENCGEAARYVGAPVPVIVPGEASVFTGKVEEWVKAIREFDNKETYQKYSVLCRARAGELDPLKELENLESFIMNARF
jgi:glycosyltransferase involved in cell wall biosynthesis